MKKISFLLLIALLTVTVATHAQTQQRFKSTTFSYKEKGAYGWGAWSMPTAVDHIVTLNHNTKRIEVNAFTHFVYNYTISQTRTGASGRKAVEYSCKDNNGTDCVVRLIYAGPGEYSDTIEFNVEYSNYTYSLKVKQL